jgi:hypothetical protein
MLLRALSHIGRLRMPLFGLLNIEYTLTDNLGVSLQEAAAPRRYHL